MLDQFRISNDASEHIIKIDQLIEEARRVFSKILPPELVEKNLEAMKLGYESGDMI